MTRDEVFPSKYLKASDLQGRPHTVTIEAAPYETLKGMDGTVQKKTVLYFAGKAKCMPLNITNFDAVCEATGCPDSDDWPSKQIELYPTKTNMGGKTVDCIRIRPVQIGGPDEKRSFTISKPLPRHPDMDDDFGAEEIPF